MIDKKALKNAAVKTIDTYSQTNFVAHEIANRLLERLDFILMKPKSILEIQSRDDYLSEALKKKYPEVNIIGLDIIERPTSHFVCGDFDSLPFINNHFDLVISNLCLQSVNFSKIFKEVHRILSPNGVFFFTLFGPDTLKELKLSFQACSTFSHVHPFIDMHDIGDLLLSHHFLDPVMDMEYLTLKYSTLNQLFLDLKSAGATNLCSDRLRGLLGKHRWNKMIEYYEQYRENEALPATIEIIYGHAWAPENKSLAFSNEEGEVVIPVSSLKK